jgi:DNA polymerase-1
VLAGPPLRRLLIDADIIAYMASASTQATYDWGDDVVSTATDFEAAKTHAADAIDNFMAVLDGDELIVCLSDDFNNFRKEVFPAYKGNRKEVERPVHLYDMKAWLAEKYPVQSRPRLEADDVMGILSTEPHPGEDRIIVSADKDMQTIPGLLYRPVGDNPRVRSISLAEADRFHLWQTITGDAVDGYPGCPGAGPVAADLALDHLTAPQSYEHVFKSGPRKGLTETRWKPGTFDTQWEAIVALYEKAGQSAKHALIQARCARILRHGEWDRRPILWSPPTG